MSNNPHPTPFRQGRYPLAEADRQKLRRHIAARGIQRTSLDLASSEDTVNNLVSGGFAMHRTIVKLTEAIAKLADVGSATDLSKAS